MSHFSDNKQNRIYPSLVETAQFQEAVELSKSAEAELAGLREGCRLWKVRSENKWFLRRYWLDANHLRLVYEPSHKPFWSNAKTYVDVIDINDVRSGWKTDNFNKMGRNEKGRIREDPGQAKRLVEKHCFSIIYGNGKSVDLVAPDEATATLWVRGLRHLVSVVRSLHQEKQYEEWVKAQFRKADKDNDGTLNFKECQDLLKYFNIKMSSTYAKQLFDVANVNKKTYKGEQVLDAEEFVHFYQLLIKRPEIEELFKKYAKLCGNSMSSYELCEFLRHEEKMAECSLETTREIIKQFEVSDAKSVGVGFITLAGFTSMITSSMFNIMRGECLDIYQDMKHPIAHYYIASSHNTYLTGNQLNSDSSVEAYISALERGCRCLELDVWDGDNDEPSIYHGHTLTTSIYVKDVLADAIKPYAFKKSNFPLILSFENHLSPKQQDKLAEHLVNILGDMLYTDAVTEDMSQLPSPVELRGKIIVKAKKMKKDAISAEASSAPSLSPDDQQTVEQAVHQESVVPSQQGEAKVKASKTFSKKLSDLVNICEAVKFQGFDYAQEKGKCYQMSSLSEKKTEQLIKSDAEDFVEYTKRQLVRIYPAGTRADSSNYDPVPSWNVGCQIVALNYQTNDKDKSFYLGKFQQNGNCGYVLKPEFLISSTPFNLMADFPITKKLVIKIISGQSLPKAKGEVKDVIDPYVKVEVRGHPKDYFQYKTRFVEDNGFNPVWNETVEIALRLPQLAVICFTLKDRDKVTASKFIASYALPVDCIATGYRHVPLRSAEGDFISPATLFVHVDWH